MFATPKKMTMKIQYLALILFLNLIASFTAVYGIKASPEPFKVFQPDGSFVIAKLHGDEHFRYLTTQDGYLITRASDKFYKYATMSSSGKIEATAINASNSGLRPTKEIEFLKKLQTKQDLSIIEKQQRSKKILSSETDVIKKSYPLSGSPKTLIILVNFSDKKFVVSKPEFAFSNLLNQDGYDANGGTGSAKDYFKDASFGKFIPEFDVVGPYTLSGKMSAYGGNNSSGEDKNSRQMVIEACKLADDAGVDFRQYDTDNDGAVDNIFIYYAGYNEAEGGPEESVWPHRWVLGNTATKFDGKIIYDYACTSELRGSSGTSMCGIGTFCHEFGHVLGLVDYYDTANSDHYTVSTWNIMDEGAYLNLGRTPPTYSAYDRFFLGWMTPVQLKNARNVKLYPILTSNKAYLISSTDTHNLDGATPEPSEFFMLENRQRSGWDAFLPYGGMLITRINYNSTTWNNNTVNNKDSLMGFNIMEADDSASFSTRTADPFPGTGNVTSYTPKLTSGTLLNKPVTEIALNSGIITFKYKGGGIVPMINHTSELTQFSTVQGTPSTLQIIQVSGSELQDSVYLSFTDGTNYEMKKESDSETAWSKKISLATNNGILSTANVQIRYNPVEPSFKARHIDMFTMSSTNAETEQIMIEGKSTRPVYVVPTVAEAATDTSMGSFIAHWNDVYDATGYYLTVYSTLDEDSKITEGFDDGLVAPLGWTLNVANLNSLSIYSGVSKPSLQLHSTGEYIETSTYFMNPTGLEFFVRSVAASGGALIVKGWDGNNWVRIDSVVVNNSLNGVQSYNFSANNVYQKFRLIYQRSNGDLSVDDISLLFTKKQAFVFEDKWVSENSSVVSYLVSDRDHYYYVKASDKALYPDSTIKYENVTAISNIVAVKTLSDARPKVLRAVVQTDKSVIVVAVDLDKAIYIYNMLGELVRTIQPDKNIITVTGLASGQIYYLRSGDREARIIL